MKIIAFSDFQKLDIRIGTVVEAAVPEWSHWVMKLTVDLGPEIKQRTVFAGIMKFYQPQDLIGKQFAFVVNLESKKIGPKEANGTQNYSQAMLLAAIQPLDEPVEVEGEKVAEKPIPLIPSAFVPNGAKIR